MNGDADRALTAAQAWMDDEDVVAVGQGEEGGQAAIVVYVEGPVAADRFPADLHGVPVVVRDSGGEIVAQAESDDQDGPRPG